MSSKLCLKYQIFIDIEYLKSLARQILIIYKSESKHKLWYALNTIRQTYQLFNITFNTVPIITEVIWVGSRGYLWTIIAAKITYYKDAFCEYHPNLVQRNCVGNSIFFTWN